MGKQLYKVELTGWVVKDEDDSDVMDWSIDAITGDMVGFEIKTTLVDSSGWAHIPITTTTATESPDLNQPTVSHTTEEPKQFAVAIDLEGAMDIELDSQGMSL